MKPGGEAEDGADADHSVLTILQPRARYVGGGLMVLFCIFFVVRTVAATNGAARAIAIFGTVVTGVTAIRALTAFCVRITDREIDVRTLYRNTHIPIANIERAYAERRLVSGFRAMKALIVQTKDGKTRAFRGFCEQTSTTRGPVERVIEAIEARIDP